MTRDELLNDIKTEVEKVLPDNDELDGDSLTSVENCINEVIQNAEQIIDDANDEEEEDATTDEPDAKKDPS